MTRTNCDSSSDGDSAAGLRHLTLQLPKFITSKTNQDRQRQMTQRKGKAKKTAKGGKKPQRKQSVGDGDAMSTDDLDKIIKGMI